MFMEELILFYNKHKTRSDKVLKKFKEYNEICSLTSFLDQHYDVIKPRQRIWHIENIIFVIQRCIVCDTIVKWDVKNGGYSKTCSHKCQTANSKSTEFRKNIIKKNLQKYGKEHFFQTNIFKKKSISTMISKYGVENYSIHKNRKEKYENTCMEKFGVKNYVKSKCYKENCKEIAEKHCKEILQRDGYENYGYIRYIGNELHEIKCPTCKNIFQINISNVYYGRNKKCQEICTICNPLNSPVSSSEKELLSFVQEIYKREILVNTRQIIKPYEIDIYLPELNLAIEYNGDYWHGNPKFYNSTDYIKQKKASVSEIWETDALKKNLCEKKNIKLVTIWETDWVNKKEVVKTSLIRLIPLS